MPQPKRAYAFLLPLLVITFLVSGVGDDKTRSEGGTYWVGATGWFSFGVVFVLTVIFSIFTLIRLARRRATRATA